MLSEEALEKLLEPFLLRQEHINNYVIQQIAKRIREIGTMSVSDSYKLERLMKTGADVREINKELARLTGLQEAEIKKIIKTVAKSAYHDTRRFFDYRRLSFIPFELNIPLQRRIKAIERVTLGTYKNLSNSKAIGFVFRDLKHPGIKKFQNIEETYQSVVDEAIQATQSGVIDYGTAMRRTLNELNESGVRALNWESGYTQRVDTAVKRNILDGIRAINQGVQDVTGEQFGADGKEITVHECPAPDHELIQGHQFSNEEWEKLQSGYDFQDIHGQHFAGIPRAIGTCNCRHFAYSIVIGVSKPVYTAKQLQQIIDRNHDGYTLPNGKHLTLYECTQKQRAMETQTRREKEKQMTAQVAGDKSTARKIQAKVSQLVKSYKAFSSACGLSPKTGNLSVSGYKKISTKF